MPRPTRTAAALIAAYAIALQSMLSGFVFVAWAGFDPTAVVCAAGNPSNDPAPLRHRGHCSADCLAACSGALPGLIPSVARTLPVFFDEWHRIFWFEALPSPQKHQPQASRAPPASI